ncbi:MAG TPA: ketopantoate reductase family protein [Candidatus Elarobacter sp.]
MKILVVGAGAVGGFFGGRVLAAGGDVTFLVRPRRAEQLRRDGLVIRGPQGETRVASPPAVGADALREHYDLVLLSCKAFDLDDAIASFAPAVGEQTAIVPLLNGMRHLDVLETRFGGGRVLGGMCAVATQLGDDGTIVQFNDTVDFAFGERDRQRTPRVDAIAAALRPGFDVRVEDDILQVMWEKWVLIVTLAGITSLMRAPIGDIVAGGGAPVAAALFDECVAIATAQGYAPRAPFVERVRGLVTAPGSPLTASMFRDVEQGRRTEHQHLIDDFLWRAADNARPSVLPVVAAHLAAYEARRTRESISAG